MFLKEGFTLDVVKSVPQGRVAEAPPCKPSLIPHIPAELAAMTGSSKQEGPATSQLHYQVSVLPPRLFPPEGIRTAAAEQSTQGGARSPVCSMGTGSWSAPKVADAWGLWLRGSPP